MYEPSHFKQTDKAALHQVMRANPLAQLVTAGVGGLIANPVPFILHADEGECGVLRAHLARPNGQWREMEAGAEALVIFQGRDAYVTPSWYASKKEHGKVVPTWNYVVVQARGTARVIQDGAWLLRHVATISDAHEDGREHPWAVTDAPPGYVEAMARGIVGIEIEIRTLSGKFKLSQNRPEADRVGVVEGLAREPSPSAADIAALVRRHGDIGS